jgi:hypothetical protein
MSQLNDLQLTKREAFYDKLRDAYRNGKLVLFCGAGCSINAGFPSFSTLTNLIANETITQLGDSIARDTQRTILSLASDDVIKAIQAITNAVDAIQYPRVPGIGKKFLARKICHHFQLAYSKTTDASLQRDLLRIGTHEGKIHVLTTNWDMLLALDTEIIDVLQETDSIAPEISCHSTVPPIPFPDTNGGIYHLHGIIDRSGKQQAELLITAEEYICAYDAGTERRRLLESLIDSDYIVLFVGYSLDDPFIWERFIKRSFEEVLKKTDNEESNFFALFQNDKKHQQKALELASLKVCINIFHYGLPEGFDEMRDDCESKWRVLGTNFRKEVRELADYITCE